MNGMFPFDRPIAMHIPRRFAMNEDEAVGFAAQRGFGLLTACDDAQPVGSHLPFATQRVSGRLLIQVHVARQNRLATLADGRLFLLAVSGVDAYVSNDWYSSPDQVSTWLYEAVHLTGPVLRMNAEANYAHGDALLQTFEPRLEPKAPWTLEAMDPGKRTAMLDAIVTLEMTVERIEGIRKLDQHKPDTDYASVVRKLERAGASAGPVADAMRAMRPHVAYDDPASGDGTLDKQASEE